jgi:hypothetical protein
MEREERLNERKKECELDVCQKVSHVVPFSCLLILLIMEILTFNVKSNYVISNTMMVFILYLLFAFSNIDSVV